MIRSSGWMVLFLWIVGTSSLVRGEHDLKKTNARPIATETGKASKSFTGYVGTCLITHSGKLMFKGPSGRWFSAAANIKKEKEGEFLNADGDRVSYEAGDTLFKSVSGSWYKAKNCSDLSKDTTETDPRCRFSSRLDKANLKAVSKSNKECAIEWESLRYTIVKRLGIPYTEMWKEPNTTEIEKEMNRMWNPEYSLWVRFRARDMALTNNPHGGDYYGPVNGFNSRNAKDYDFRLGYPAENTWPTFGQGSTVDEIAFNLTESRAAASDGYSMGLNYHPGHAENVMRTCDVIGVGVNLSDNGSVTAYFQFANKIGK